MYKTKTVQMTFENFNQSCGMKLNVNDERGVVAGRVDWNAVEERYREFFPLKLRHPTLGARKTLGALIIQQRRGSATASSSRRSAVTPYCQYFIGMVAYQTKCPFKHGVLFELRKYFGKGFLVFD